MLLELLKPKSVAKWSIRN